MPAHLLAEKCVVVASGPFIFGNQITVPTMIYHDFEDIIVRYGPLLEIFVYIVEFCVAGF